MRFLRSVPKRAITMPHAHKQPRHACQMPSSMPLSCQVLMFVRDLTRQKFQSEVPVRQGDIVLLQHLSRWPGGVCHHSHLCRKAPDMTNINIMPEKTYMHVCYDNVKVLRSTNVRCHGKETAWLAHVCKVALGKFAAKAPKASRFLHSCAPAASTPCA